VPKSVSAEMMIRSSTAASARSSSSLAAAKPMSRTWMASWPASRRPSATYGERALSTRNFMRG
jgi:hypothetical protein